jgi:putative membrane protein
MNQETAANYEKPKIMKRLLMTWVLNAASLPITKYLVDQVLPKGMGGMEFTDASGAAVAAFALATVNTFIRPVLKFLTFPLTFFTLGLSAIGLNRACLMAVDAYAEGFKINGWQSILAGTLGVSIVSTVLNMLFNRKD